MYYEKTKIAAAKLLEVTAEQLADFGRPRKLPGKDRPDYQGVKKSLPAAFGLAAIVLGTKPSAKAAAIDELLYASRSITGHYLASLKDLDNEVPDTRALIRALDTAKKAIAA